MKKILFLAINLCLFGEVIAQTVNENYQNEYLEESGMIKSSRNPFISSSLDSETNNFLFHADKRFKLTYNKESVGGNTYINSLFDGNYDQHTFIINNGETLSLDINLTEKNELGSTGLIYANGYVVISTYWTAEISNLSVDVERNHPTTGLSSGTYSNYEEIPTGNRKIYRIYIGGNYVTNMRINISSNTDLSRITEVEYLLSRPVNYQLSGVSKYRNENFYKQFRFKNYDNETQVLLDPNGKIGIGTDDPKAKLHINGEGYTANKITSTVAADLHLGIENDVLILRKDNNNARFFSIDNSNNIIQDNILVLKNNGNVGIGTDSPNQKLEVNGDIIINDSDNAHTHIQLGPESNDAIITDNREDKHYGGGYFFRVTPDSTYTSASYIDVMMLDDKGNVGVRTKDTKGYQLAVAGNKGIIAEKVTVKLQGQWADYVFRKDYNLPTLEEVEKHIEEKGHLNNIPSAKEVEKNGVFELGEMNRKLLEKIEELTLYLIEQNHKNKEQEDRILELEKKLTKLTKLINK